MTTQNVTTHQVGMDGKRYNVRLEPDGIVVKTTFRKGDATVDAQVHFTRSGIEITKDRENPVTLSSAHLNIAVVAPREGGYLIEAHGTKMRDGTAYPVNEIRYHRDARSIVEGAPDTFNIIEETLKAALKLDLRDQLSLAQRTILNGHQQNMRRHTADICP